MRIVAVEDDPDLRLLVGFNLGGIEEGHDVRVLDITDAVNLRDDEWRDVDLLVTDWSMPGINGGQLATHALRANPNLRVIVLTAHAAWRSDTAVPHEVAAERLGSDLPDTAVVWQKPVSLEVIRSWTKA